MATMTRTVPNRNRPCPCGSGRKYKNCCFSVVNVVPVAPVPSASTRVQGGVLLNSPVPLHGQGNIGTAVAPSREVLQQDHAEEPATAVEPTSPPNAGHIPFPAKINLGSGKDFRADYLNIDINDYWTPDVVANVSIPLFHDGEERFDTPRFGRILVKPGSFDEIISNDVFEHVPDLVATMTNCLALLRVGGVLCVSVPYDLSYGAWQDPTHVRAFNERSWLYYTDWFWYLGWQTHRFVVRNLEFVLSAQGQQMHAEKVPDELVIRTPRSVDSMKVTLEKIALSPTDRETLAHFTKRRSI
jgi:SAM-dependent methyltransferase